MPDIKTIIRALAGPLEAEKRRGYRDTAIIGQSIGRYVQSWAETASAAFQETDAGAAAGAPAPGDSTTVRPGRPAGRRRVQAGKPAPSPPGQRIVREVLAALGDYQRLDSGQREQRVRDARRLLVELLTEVAKPEPAPTTEPQAAAPSQTSGEGTRRQEKARPGRRRQPRSDQPQPASASSRSPARESAHGQTGALALLDQPVAADRKPPPTWAKRLANLGIHTNRDLLYHFPRGYLPIRPLSELADGEHAAVLVQAGAREESVLREGRGFRLLRYLLDVKDATGVARVSSVARLPRYSGRAQLIANSPLALNYQPGTEVLIEGSVRRAGPHIEIQYGGSERVSDGAGLSVGALVPVYPLTEGVYQGQVRSAVRRLLERLPHSPAQAGEHAGSRGNAARDRLDDPLPESLRQRHHLPALATALWHLHWPPSQEAREAARRRMAFEELLVLELAMAQRKRECQRPAAGIRMPPRADVIEVLSQVLPFSLTRAQQRVIAELTADMASDTPMYRLLQGDVGSGKTVVALAALVIAAQNGYQGALMAPTELLAEQHYLVLAPLLQPVGVQVLLLTGSVRGQPREHALRQLRAGRPAVVVGTHALIQEGVAFGRLGLVIVDEQHRFGVRQRAELLTKAARSDRASSRSGARPHMLIMTATPIPRSLALTLYGDLDLSVLDEMPPGRQQVTTRWYALPRTGPASATGPAADAFALVRRHVAEGKQAYVVCPLIEESEELQAEAATKMAEALQRDDFSDLRVGLLHGAMGVGDREAVMEAFRSGEVHVLTATTVIEVGVDVPNATIMVIMNAERFGLAQLHQLRGRVGRGGDQSYCLLLTPAKYDPTGRLAPAGEESVSLAQRRLAVMLDTTDGFAIAEQDLLLRGPGELYGTRQHGLPDFRLARLAGDLGVLTEAREAAFTLVGTDPDLTAHAHRALRAPVAELRARMETPSG